jgi:hypothetical protein
MEAVLVLFVLVQALIIGAFCYYIAGQKNRNEVGWFLLGFLFSFVALIALVAVPKIEKLEYQPSSASPTPSLLKPIETPSRSTERACPFCAETIKVAAKICRFCQRDVDSTALEMQNVGVAGIGIPDLAQSTDWTTKDEEFCTSGLMQHGFDVAFSVPTKWSITSPSKGTTTYAYSLADLQKIAGRTAAA